MSSLVGIDGCKGAWISVLIRTDSQHLYWKKLESISELFKRAEDIEVVGIDIPIGLTEKGPRYCDKEARKLLKKRGSCVFPAPVRAVLDAKEYKTACEIRKRIEGEKMSQQSWAIVPKIREVDALLHERPELCSLLYEVHPEVSFYFMGGKKPNNYSKKNALGIEERINKLSAYFRIDHDYIKDIRKQHDVSEDDIVDALAALWSSFRIFRNENEVLVEKGTGEGAKIYA